MEVNMKLLKWSSLFFNFIMLIFGPALIAVSLRLVFDPNFSYVFFPHGNFFWGYIIAALGALITVIGILGCVGTMAENSCLLWTFFVAMLVFMVVEIAAGVFIYKQQVTFRENVNLKIRKGMLIHYGTGTIHNSITDIIQQGWQCCGTTGYQSWSLSNFGKQAVFHESLGDSTYTVPKSCCIDKKSDDCHEVSVLKGVSNTRNNAEIVYTDGCEEKIATVINDYARASLIIIPTLVLLQIISLVITAILAVAIRSKQGYVDHYSSRHGLNSSHTSAPMLSTSSSFDFHSAESGDLRKHYGNSNPSSVNASRSSLNLEPVMKK